MSSVINTNVSSLIAQNSLLQNNTNLNTSLERLSTGLQINSGADNPAGLIAGLALQQEQTGISTATGVSEYPARSLGNRVASSVCPAWRRARYARNRRRHR